MQTETEIRETIAKLRAAMDADSFKPVVDGTHLKEHVYYLRLGAIQSLEDVVKTQEEKDAEDALADQCPIEEDPCEGCYPGECVGYNPCDGCSGSRF